MNQYKYIIRIVFLAFFIFSMPMLKIQAQVTSGTNIGSVKSEQVPDEQVKLLMQKALDSGMSAEQIEAIARSRGMSQTEIDKIKTRAEILNAIKSTKKDNGSSNQRIIPNQNVQYPLSLKDRLGKTTTGVKNNVFGESLFNNKDLTFNPGINIATPKNYQLGPGDILNIDVWGASQKSYQEIISPEGKIIISNVGPVFISGLTVGEATIKIKKYLSRIYAGLSKGNTQMALSLGGLRSIRVNIVGEINLPGTYNLSSLSTVFNALYAAGGPSADGSLRNVKIIRDNKTKATLDFYEFLLKGTLTGNMRLQDQDVIFVSPYRERVKAEGQVKRNMFFDLKPGETLTDLVHFAGGFTGKAYTQRIKIFRKTTREKKILVVNPSQQDTLHLTDGDRIVVDSVLNRFENRVQITGAVMRPGAFAIDSISTLKELIQNADGLRKDAFQNRIVVYRLKNDLTRETIPMDLSGLLQSGHDFTLQREDSVHIPSFSDIHEKSNVQISGQVARPGMYPYTRNIRLEDLIIQAGGLLESASMAHIDVARRIRDTLPNQAGTNLSQTFQLPIDKDKQLPDSVKNFKLFPFDQVFIRKSPSYTDQLLVSIDGEVTYPGRYSIQNKNERISELIIRAGNLTPQAYLKGASLIRKRTSLILHDKAVQNMNAANDSEKNKIIVSNDRYNVIGINLESIINHPGSIADLVLQAGDSIQILKKSQTVKVSGAVYRPNVIPYVEGFTLQQYISNAGGYTKDATRRNVYVIYANGSVKKTSMVLFFKNYPKIEPGAEIIVPLKSKNRNNIPASMAIGISTGLASLALMVVTIVKTIKP